MSKGFDETVEDLGGKAKEAAGNVVDNDSLKNEGKADQTKSDFKEKLSDAGETIKEKASEAGEAIKDKANEVLGSFQDDKDEDNK